MLRRHRIKGGTAAWLLLTMLVMGGIVLCCVTALPLTSVRVTQTVLGESATPTALMAAGYNHSLLVHSDGTLWAWGNNDYGQLGLGDSVSRNTPTQVGSATNWMAVCTGQQHSLGLHSDGTLWAWGNGDSGQLGLSNVSKKVPTKVGSATSWVAIAAGDNHSLGVRSNGTLWAWGANGNGQLGFGDAYWRFQPYQVGSATKWVTVAGASNYSLGLRSDGTLWAWGKGDTGQLGVGEKTVDDKYWSPNRVGSATNWVRVRPGPVHCLGVRSDGTLWAWGSNYDGQLGLGDTTERLSPAQVGSATNWVTGAAGAGEAGDAFSLGLRSDGTIWSWGSNYGGELGLGDTTRRLSPTHVNLTGAVPPSIDAVSATVTSATAATLNGNLTSLGTALSVQVSFEWGLTTEYGRVTPAQTMAAIGAFSADLTGLSANTTYHFRVKAVGEVTTYGDDLTFATGTIPPAVTTSAATAVDTTSATLHGSLTNRGTASSVQVYFEWGPTTSYGNATTPTTMTYSDAFNFTINDLAAGTTYHYRAKAVGAGEVHGDDLTFVTGTTPPTVTSGDATILAATSGILNGNLTSLGTAASVTVSFEWGTTTGYGSVTTAQSMSAAGTFGANLAGLDADTTYHFRAKAAGDGPAVYGDDMTFATTSLGDTAAPVISSENATSITVSGATITWATDEAATSQVQYGPTDKYGSTKTAASNLVNSHSVDLTGLKAGKTYHYRVVSKDAANNEAVSEDCTFTTAGSPSGGVPTWVWALVGLAVVGVVGSAGFLVRRRLAKK